MAFEYGCFISYVSPHEELMTEFMGSLVAALKGELEPLLGAKSVYYDEDRLAPGDNHEPALGSGICASACWILVYVPQYAEHPYCRREFLAMQQLEERRRRTGFKLPNDLAMIIPILLRGSREELPHKLQGTVAMEFNRYTVAEPKINTSAHAMQKIRKLAHRIREVHAHGADLEPDCQGFAVPPDNGGGLQFNRTGPRFPRL